MKYPEEQLCARELIRNEILNAEDRVSMDALKLQGGFMCETFT